MTAPAAPITLGRELRGLWRLALPLALAQAGQATMGLVDTAVVGRLSPTAQAGAGLGTSLSFTALFFGMGVMLALDPLVSQAVGAGRRREAREHLWQGVWLALATSVPVMLVTAALPLALPWAGVDAPVSEAAGTFVFWRLAAAPGVLLFVGTRSYLQAVGRASMALWGTVLANVLNLGLDIVLVYGAGPVPALGLRGAALATVVSAWAQLAVLVAGVGGGPADVRRRPDVRALLAAARIGVPVGLHFIAESGVFTLTGVLAGRLGAVESAAHQAALTWASLTFSVATGIGSAAATRVGWAIGAGRRGDAKLAGVAAMWSGAVFMGLAAVLLLAAPEVLARLLSDDERVQSVVVSLVVVAAVFQVSDGLQAVGAGALRGAGETGYTFRANVVGHWLLGLPVAVALGFWLGLGVVGLWWGLSVGLTGVAVALVRRFLRLVPG